MQLHEHFAFLTYCPCHNASESRRPEVNEQMAFTHCPCFRLVSLLLISACLKCKCRSPPPSASSKVPALAFSAPAKTT